MTISVWSYTRMVAAPDTSRAGLPTAPVSSSLRTYLQAASGGGEGLQHSTDALIAKRSIAEVEGPQAWMALQHGRQCLCCLACHGIVAHIQPQQRVACKTNVIMDTVVVQRRLCRPHRSIY